MKVKQFEQTSSTKLELQILLWALDDIQLAGHTIVVHTDSQNIISLPGRRKRFEQNNYHSKTGKLHKNYRLYQEFYRITEDLNCEWVKVKGHKVASQKNDIDRVFTLVDKAARNALRNNKDF